MSNALGNFITSFPPKNGAQSSSHGACADGGSDAQPRTKPADSSLESMFAAAGCTREGNVVELKGDFVLVGCLKTEKMATPHTHLSDGT